MTNELENIGIVGDPKQLLLELTDKEMRAFEANNIRAALAQCHGKIYGSNGAAALLGLKPTTLNSRIAALRIKE